MLLRRVVELELVLLFPELAFETDELLRIGVALGQRDGRAAVIVVGEGFLRVAGRLYLSLLNPGDLRLDLVDLLDLGPKAGVERADCRAEVADARGRLPEQLLDFDVAGDRCRRSPSSRR